MAGKRKKAGAELRDVHVGPVGGGRVAAVVRGARVGRYPGRYRWIPTVSSRGTGQRDRRQSALAGGDPRGAGARLCGRGTSPSLRSMPQRDQKAKGSTPFREAMFGGSAQTDVTILLQQSSLRCCRKYIRNTR